MSASLLVELLCEELPPKALQRLGDAFAQEVANGLVRGRLIDGSSVAGMRAFATPRRLAVWMPDVRPRGLDEPRREKVLPVSIAFDAQGRPTAPLLKKLAALGLTDADVPALQREHDGKAEALFHTSTVPGRSLADALQDIVVEALKKLPIPKVMSYQLPDLTTVQFVRPVHRLVALHGPDVVPIEVLGLRAGHATLGHRFMSAGDIVIGHADAYAETLERAGKVIASFEARRERIAQQLDAHADGATVVKPAALLDEVTALVEWPVVYAGRFDRAFLDVPQEVLILTMQLNQKYFALERDGRLIERFLLVSNLDTADPSLIVGGNERVLRARLADAKFFYDTDRKQPLLSHLEGLKHVTYHNKLGAVFERVRRIETIAALIARTLAHGLPAADETAVRTEAAQAATVLKCDLLTHMVGEFPELQGVMGAYYAAHDRHARSIVDAIRVQYLPRFTDATLARDPVVASTYLAERLETLIGIWGIGLAPTGEKDPYALRRAALGLIDVFDHLGAHAHGLSLRALLDDTKTTFDRANIALAPGVVDDVLDFIYDRARHQLATRHDRDAVDAVIALRPPLHELAARIAAVERFRTLPEAQSLAAANKRIGNILKKAEAGTQALDATLFDDDAERTLATRLDAVRPRADASYARGEYAEALATLAQLRTPVDAFFEHVMVMADDARVRANRIALLRELHGAMNRVADLSRLAA